MTQYKKFSTSNNSDEKTSADINDAKAEKFARDFLRKDFQKFEEEKQSKALKIPFLTIILT